MNQTKRWINVAIFLVAGYLLFSGNRGIWNLYKLHQEKKSLSNQVVNLKNQIDRCQMECQYFSKNTSVLEKQAREELDLIKPGELVYKFSKNDGQ